MLFELDICIFQLAHEIINSNLLIVIIVMHLIAV